MNLSLVKELSSIYEASILDQAALFKATDKIKPPKDDDKKLSNSRVNSRNFNSQLASACWNLLISINKSPATHFFTVSIIEKTAKVVLICSKMIILATELKIGKFDLDKLLANIVLKLVEAVKINVEKGKEDLDIINLVAFCFDRLQSHSHSIESGVRRMSLVELPQIDDPLADINYHGLSPDSTKDPILMQIATVQLESLLKIALIIGAGPITDIFDTLRPFHVHSHQTNPQKCSVAQLFSSVSRLQAWSRELEWSFWEYACGHQIYSPHLDYFKRRCHLKLSPPPETAKLNSTIIASVLMSNQLHEQMLSLAEITDLEDDFILGAALVPLCTEENLKLIPKISSIIVRMTAKPLSSNGLKYLLQSLDNLRSSLHLLCRFDGFVSLCTSLNDCLIRIQLPQKFYVSWTTCLIKSVVDSKRVISASVMRSLLDVSIEGLISSSNSLTDDLRCKAGKVVEQCLSLAGNIILVEKFVKECKGSLNAVLENSVFNLSPNFFKELTRFTFEQASSDSSILEDWVKVLSAQVGVKPDIFSTADTKLLHRLAALISHLVFDPVKKDSLTALIYQKMGDSGSIKLSKILVVLRSAKSDCLAQSYSEFNDNVNTLLNTLVKFKQISIWPSEIFLDFKPKVCDNCMEIELYEHFLNSACIHSSEECFSLILSGLSGLSSDIDKCISMMSNVENYDFGPEMSPIIKQIHAKYLEGDEKEALKLGYSKLKHFLKSPASGTETVFETIELILYLHRLSVSTRNLSEAKYFVKQLRHLAESSKSANIKKLVDKVHEGLLKLTGSDKKLVNLFDCESILKSPQYRIFAFEYQSLKELEQIRERVKSFYPGPRNQYHISCNGIRMTSKSVPDNLIKELEVARIGIKHAEEKGLYYCVREWSKVALFLQYHVSFYRSCDSELLELFEQSRTSEKFTIDSSYKLAGSVGMLFDQFMSIFWVFIVSSSGSLSVYLIRMGSQSYMSKLQRLQDICSQSTDTLRNSEVVSSCSEKKVQWWKTRKNLDAELTLLCSEFDDELFAYIPTIKLSLNNDIKNLLSNLNDFLRASIGDQIYFDDNFVALISAALGSCPSRIKIEGLLNMISYNLAFSSESTSFDLDVMIPKLRKAFESSNDVSNDHNNPINLILDKEMNLIPFECFLSFKGNIFRRVPLLNLKKPKSSSSLEPFQKVFYVVNPSGDLHQTQERFESVFKNQPNWTGVIGRAPTSDEFLHGICGLYDLFIYFGHSSGESYTSLKDLKSKIRENGASSALLIGCSSGKIKSNGIFPPESAIFHYLENKSPMILANLWDVTDKDIDMYIKGVLEDSDLLSKTSSTTNLNQSTTATTIIEKAHKGRERCFLKALNGYAPIVYGMI